MHLIGTWGAANILSCMRLLRLGPGSTPLNGGFLGDLGEAICRRPKAIVPTELGDDNLIRILDAVYPEPGA